MSNFSFLNIKKLFLVLCVLSFLLPVSSAFGKSNPEILFVLDVSGSMGDKAGGVQKLQAAKNSIYSIAPELSDKDINLGLMHFSGCGGVSYSLPPGSNNSSQINSVIGGLSPGGGTPLADALRQAGNQMRASSADQKRIVLLSDGKESCGGDPVSVVSRFSSSDLKVHVIGFDVGSDAVSQLSAIAAAGNGQFNQAINAQQLRDLFEKLSEDLQKNLLKMMRSCVELGAGNLKESAIREPERLKPTQSNNERKKWTIASWHAIEGYWDYFSSEFALSGPAFAQSLPSWVKNPEKNYPSSRYLTAVGSSSSLMAAKNQAKSELSNIFSQKIKSVQSMDERTRETSSGSGSNFSQKLKMRTQVQVESASELIGAKIEKSESVFQDGRMQYFALAVIDKSSAISNYRDKFEDSNRTLKSRYDQSNNIDDPIRKLQLLTEARKAANEVQRYQSLIEVIENMGVESDAGADQSSDNSSFSSGSSSFEDRANSFGRSSGQSSSEPDNRSRSSANTTQSGISSPHVTPAEIDSEINSIMDELSVNVGPFKLNNICEGSGISDQLEGNIKEQFNKLDFRISTSDTVMISTNGRLTANYTSKGRKSDEAIRWDLTLELKNEQTGRTIGTINQSHVSVGLDKAQVASRTRYDIRNWLNDNLDDLISEKLLSS